MAGKRPWWRDGTVLWSVALSSMCLLVSRLLDDPSDNFGGSWLHFLVLGGSGALLATAVVLLVLRRRPPRGR
ncbi:hypothetical protein [Paractinoplanes atraurantiacus]|uniref:Uncharacterized protein n=1 Tax=Paractinoplanes atraurantiacus TaxID=1036182 RepID=A0A285JRS5_9ACTN|nr:hypothetical protein [Actinoplanes atraurantiacus]SNY63014.1 hypothetical protein SAMN05421748_124166 [Actinoplanes atraurantiacus]